jgi:uncharacterized protein YdaU (DUF1376 family)
MRLDGLFWWIPRWLKSSAKLTMSLEEQGAYRNLLDAAQLRGGALPDDEKILAKACGDPMRWKAVRGAVMPHFVKRKDGWHNETLDEVIAVSVKRAEKQKAYRDSLSSKGKGNGHSNAKRNGRRNARGNATG